MVRFPLLGEKVPGKWNLLLSREFHMTDDSHLFKDDQTRGRLPLYEGKMIHQFDSNFAKTRYWIDEQSGRKVILGSTPDRGQLLDYQDYRFCMRRIARNTDERTIISTILPKHTFGSESLHLSTGRSLRAQELLFLVGVLNTFVLDACIRQRVAANVNMFYVYQLPVPRIDSSDRSFQEVVLRAARLVCVTKVFDEFADKVGLDRRKHSVSDPRRRSTLRAEIDAIVAHLYELTEDEFAHILSTFPLVPEAVKTLSLNTFRAMLPSADDKIVRKLIEGHETDKVEFKEGAAYSTQRNQKSPDMIRNVVREIAAFLNSGGGNVLLGVTDTSEVVGIADDLLHADPKKKNRDGYELFLRNSIGGKLGIIQSSACKISFHKIENLEVCRIFVPAATSPVYLEGNLIVRDGSSSRQLNAEEAAAYVARHWAQF